MQKSVCCMVPTFLHTCGQYWALRSTEVMNSVLHELHRERLTAAHATGLHVFVELHRVEQPRLPVVDSLVIFLYISLGRSL